MGAAVELVLGHRRDAVEGDLPPRMLPLRVVELVAQVVPASVGAAEGLVVVALPISMPGMRNVPTLVCFVLPAVPSQLIA